MLSLIPDPSLDHREIGLQERGRPSPVGRMERVRALFGNTSPDVQPPIMSTLRAREHTRISQPAENYRHPSNLFSCQWAEIRHGWDTGRTESTRIPSVRIMSRELGRFIYHDVAVVYGPGDVTHQKCKFAMQCNVSNNLSDAPSDFLSKRSRSSSELNITVTT